jgi:membrane-associated phospholipid phosphatase
MSSIRRLGAVFFVLLLLQLSTISTAIAQEAKPSEASEADVSESNWSDEWARPGWFEAALAGGLFAGGAAIQFGIGPPDEPGWIGPILADGLVRESLLADSPDGEALAGLASDSLLFAMVGAPLLLQPGLIWMTKDDGASAGRMALINAQSLAITFFSTVALKHTIGRQRPASGACWDDPNANDSCDDRDRLSFPSGHTSMAFAGAGLVCLNHEIMRPFGNGWDQVACYTALGAATATGVFRMVANKHFMTDVVVGATLGLTAGYLLPKWLYFGFGDSTGILSDHNATISPSIGEVNGVNFSFTW